MNKQKIAILTDSCTDVPKNLVEKYNMYVVPLKIIYRDHEYTDGVDITPREVYDGLSKEIPKTSLPCDKDITGILDKIKADGYEKVLAVTISSGLSGTNSFMNLICKNYEGLDCFVLDTKNIAIGAGFNSIMAAEYIAQGMDWETLKETVTKNTSNAKVFFTVATLEYLQKGGRIGLVSSILGNTLNLKPIITCNPDGIYYTVEKVIGRKKCFKHMCDIILDYAKKSQHYNIAIVHGDGQKEADEIKEFLLPLLPNCNIYTDGQISPALGVHTGPGTIGIGIQLI